MGRMTQAMMLLMMFVDQDDIKSSGFTRPVSSSPCFVIEKDRRWWIYNVEYFCNYKCQRNV